MSQPESPNPVPVSIDSVLNSETRPDPYYMAAKFSGVFLGYDEAEDRATRTTYEAGVAIHDANQQGLKAITYSDLHDWWSIVFGSTPPLELVQQLSSILFSREEGGGYPDFLTPDQLSFIQRHR